MNRWTNPNGGRPLASASLLLAALIGATGLLWPTVSAQAAERSQYCDAERGNACNDHESSNSSPSPRGGSATDPATPAEPDPPADPDPTPETPT